MITKLEIKMINQITVTTTHTILQYIFKYISTSIQLKLNNIFNISHIMYKQINTLNAPSYLPISTTDNITNIIIDCIQKIITKDF